MFDSIIVVTDRRILDKQIRDTIKQFAQVGATVGHAEHSGDLRKFIESGKKIIISTVQKFPFILDEIGNEHRGRRFAIIIDEAHSSQGGKTSAAMSAWRSSTAGAEEDDETIEDTINRLMEARKLLPNASYFAFTATPKNKTLEIFGEPYRGRRQGQAPAVPQLHDEAGDPGGLHPRRAASTTRRSTATTSWSRRSRATRSSTPSAPRRSCAATSRATTTRSGSRPRSWSTTSTSRCSR